MAGDPILELEHISKAFPGVLANDDITWHLKQGEVHAFLGENGAGKSTLMNIIYGLYQPDTGQIKVRGRVTRMSSPQVSIRLGIGMVHQHFMLVPTLTVAENIVLGCEPRRNGLFYDRQAAQQSIGELSQKFGLAVDPTALVKDISVGLQQRVEIVKALYRGASILILDEPTAVLTPQEADELFITLRQLREAGQSIIFITHKMKEVLKLSDRVTVLRGGRIVGEADPKAVDEQALAALVVGREVSLQVSKTRAQPGDIVLDVEGLSAENDRRLPALRGLSFQVRAGEVLGIAGVEGNGQTELVEVLTGLRPSLAGHTRLLGQDVTASSPRQLLDLGVAHIPEDRHSRALVMEYPVAHNLVLSTFHRPPFARGIFINWQWLRLHAADLVQEYDVRTPNVDTPAGNLSGGNQQKVVVAREFSRPIRLLIASQPTRGVDAGATEFIHRKIVAKRDGGCAVLLVSAELDEVMGLADRIAVIYRGRLVITFPADQASRELLGLYMTGQRGGTGALGTGSLSGGEG